MPTETGSSPEVLKPKKSFLKKEKDKILRVLTADYMSSEESDAIMPMTMGREYLRERPSLNQA